MTNYMELIKQTIQDNPDINQIVVADVLTRTKYWLSYSDSSEYDDYVKRQYEYLINFI